MQTLGALLQSRQVGTTWVGNWVMCVQQAPLGFSGLIPLPEFRVASLNRVPCKLMMVLFEATDRLLPRQTLCPEHGLDGPDLL